MGQDRNGEKNSIGSVTQRTIGVARIDRLLGSGSLYETKKFEILRVFSAIQRRIAYAHEFLGVIYLPSFRQTRPILCLQKVFKAQSNR